MHPASQLEVLFHVGPIGYGQIRIVQLPMPTTPHEYLLGILGPQTLNNYNSARGPLALRQVLLHANSDIYYQTIRLYVWDECRLVLIIVEFY